MLRVTLIRALLKVNDVLLNKRIQKNILPPAFLCLFEVLCMHSQAAKTNKNKYVIKNPFGKDRISGYWPILGVLTNYQCNTDQHTNHHGNYERKIST